jgi:23S rRNA (uracil1939-C5)-methyltransferase
MDRYAVPAYCEADRTGAIRHVFCRYAFSTNEAQVTVVSAEKHLPHIDALIRGILEECPEMTSIVLNINQTAGNTVLAGRFQTIWGGDCITAELCSLNFRLSPAPSIRSTGIRPKNSMIRSRNLPA